jgi:CDP-glucose 4,6-dehydratase
LVKSLKKEFSFDIKNFNKLENVLKTYKPEIIFHLAAQTSVLESYEDPLDSIYSNIIGTSNLLSSVRKKSFIKTVVIVSTDKVYKNNEKNIPFSENDSLGGSDIYSASKTGSDILTQSFYHSFFKNSLTKISIVRAGNVIGGGDWKKDRLIPDCLKSIATNNNVVLRNPYSIRPWQHVLEPLSGYIHVAKKTFHKKSKNYIWNFGPKKSNSIKVIDITKKIISKYKSKSKIIIKKDKTNKENKYLRLNSSNSNKILGWKPVWNIDETLKMTVEWHKAWINKKKT